MALTKQQVAKRRRWSLADLDEMNGVTQAVDVRSVTDAVNCLRHARCVSTAGNDGAITVWRGRKNMWRGEFNRYKARVGGFVSEHKKDAIAFLKEWWPKLGKDSSD